MAIIKKKKRPVSYHLVNIGIVLLGLFAILPIVWTFYTSLRTNVDINKLTTFNELESIININYTSFNGGAKIREKTN